MTFAPKKNGLSFKHPLSVPVEISNTAASIRRVNFLLHPPPPHVPRSIETTIKGDLAHSTSPPSRRSSIPSKNCIETKNLYQNSRRFRLSQSRTQLSFQGSPLLDRSTACRKNFVHCLADGPLPRPVMSIGFRIPERRDCSSHAVEPVGWLSDSSAPIRSRRTSKAAFCQSVGGPHR